jgi:hypothetical protein
MPHLVAISRAKIVRPSRQALNLAVNLLLRTQMPKWHAAKKRRTQEFAKLTRSLGREDAIKQQSSDPMDLDANEFSNLERNVFLISRHIGLLSESEFFSDFGKEGTLIHESLEHWIDTARDIQNISRIKPSTSRGQRASCWPSHNLACPQIERRLTTFASKEYASRADLPRGPNDRGRHDISGLCRLRHTFRRRWSCTRKASPSALLQQQVSVGAPQQTSEG